MMMMVVIVIVVIVIKLLFIGVLTRKPSGQLLEQYNRHYKLQKDTYVTKIDSQAKRFMYVKIQTM